MTSSTELLSPRVIGRPTWTRFSTEGDAVFELVGRLSPDELMSNIFTDRLLKYMTPAFIKEINDKTAVFLKSHRNMLTQLPGIAIRTLYLYGERDFRRALEDFLYQALCQLLEGNDQKMSLALPFKELIAVPANLAELLFEMTETDKKRKIDEADWMNKLAFNQFRPPAAMLLHWSNQPLLCHSVELISNSLNDNYRHFMFYYAVGLLKCFVEDSRTVDGKLKLRPREQIMRSVEQTHEKAQPMPRQTAKRRRTTPSTTEHPAAPLDMNRHYLTTPITECNSKRDVIEFVRAPHDGDIKVPGRPCFTSCLVYGVWHLQPDMLLEEIVGTDMADECKNHIPELWNNVQQQLQSLKLAQAELLADLNPPWLSEDSNNYFIGNSRKLRASAANIFWRKMFNKLFGGLSEILPSQNAKQLVDVVLSAVNRWNVSFPLNEAYDFKINARTVPFVDSLRTMLASEHGEDEIDEIQLAVYSNINMFFVFYMIHIIRRVVDLEVGSSPYYSLSAKLKQDIQTVLVETKPRPLLATMSCRRLAAPPAEPESSDSEDDDKDEEESYDDSSDGGSSDQKKDVTKNLPEPEVICLSSDED